jgi:hypothetical protein
VVERRVILVSRLQKAATKQAENSSQFAVWSLNRVIIKLKDILLEIIKFINNLLKCVTSTVVRSGDYGCLRTSAKGYSLKPDL